MMKSKENIMMKTITLRDFCLILTAEDLYSELITYLMNNKSVYRDVVKDIIHKRCKIENESNETNIIINSLVSKLTAFISNLKDSGDIEKPINVSDELTIVKPKKEERRRPEVKPVMKQKKKSKEIDFEGKLRESNGSFYIYVPTHITKKYNLKKDELAIIRIATLSDD